MPSANQVKALISSHADGDEQRFYSVALQVAAQAARQGHIRFAQELRDLIDRAKRTAPTPRLGQHVRPVNMVQPRGELAGLLTASYPKTRMGEMALDPATRARIDRVLAEQRDRAHIRSHGLAPIRRLLLVGVPGTGKTMIASVLAGELSLPLFSVQLHGLITKYLGETAAKLRLIFDAVLARRMTLSTPELVSALTERKSAQA